MKALSFQEQVTKLGLSPLEFKTCEVILLKFKRLKGRLTGQVLGRSFVLWVCLGGIITENKDGLFRTKMKREFFFRGLKNLCNSQPQGTMETEPLNMLETEMFYFHWKIEV